MAGPPVETDVSLRPGSSLRPPSIPPIIHPSEPPRAMSRPRVPAGFGVQNRRHGRERSQGGVAIARRLPLVFRFGIQLGWTA